MSFNLYSGQNSNCVVRLQTRRRRCVGGLNLLAGLLSTAVATTAVASGVVASGDDAAVRKAAIAADLKSLFVGAEKLKLRQADIGIWVSSVGRPLDQPVFEHNGSKSFIPASLSKIPTAIATLIQLPSSYRFKTVFSIDSKHLLPNQTVAGGVLNGPLYLIGGGDPSFVSENLWFLVNELTRTKVKTVEGDLVVDDSLFDSIRFDSDRQEQRVDRAYDAPIGALSFNWNAITTWVRPGPQSGAPADVVLDVGSPFFEMRNAVKTAGKDKALAVSVERLKRLSTRGGDIVEASGKIGENAPEKAFYKSIREPALAAGHAAAVFLQQRGIEVKGVVRAGRVPDGAVVVAISESKPVHAVVSDMLKWSNNYVAEMLVKNLAATGEPAEHPATMGTGLKRVRDWIETKAGLVAGEYEYINAAGLTRINRFSPKQLVQMLLAVQHDFRVFPEFLSALPMGGVDGTLRSRMKNGSGGGSIRAKTGLLDGVVGLAGYAGNADGEIYTFAFIFNGSPGKEAAARSLFDRFADRLAN